MDKTFEALRAFLLERANENLPDGLKKFDKKTIVFGLVDVAKFPGAKVIVSILPEREELGTGNDFDNVVNSEFLITVICGGSIFEDVQKNTVLYAHAIENALFECTEWEDEIEDVQFNDAVYTFDAGSIPGQLSAVEIRLTVQRTAGCVDDPF